VFGTGTETPLGKQDPTRAAEAAAYVRKAFSLSIPRDEIIKQMAAGYGHPGTVPIPWSAPEYDRAGNTPIPYDMDAARQMLAKAGYS
jgi:peptide/nickel transport system substrate-binding protein